MPMVPLIWALRSAGHDVLVAGTEDVVRAAETAGLPAAPLGGGDSVPRKRSVPGHLGVDRAGEHGGVWEAGWDRLARRWLGRIDTVLDDYLALAARWRPDLVLCEPLEFSGLIVGGVHDVPVVQHRWGPDVLTTQAWGPAREILHTAAVEAGCDSGLPAPSLIVDPCPPSLQHPEAAAARTVRYLPYNGPGRLPAEVPARSGRRVLVCLGTRSLALDGRRELTIAALEACAGLEAVVTCVPEHQEELRARAPESVTIVDPVPLNLVMDGFDCAVVYGGAGTTHTALHFGVPQVVLAPGHPVLQVLGERLEACEAGRLVPEAEQGDPERIRAALLDVLDDPRHREGAERLRDEMAAQPAPSELVGALETLAR
ncbi:MULTISPECIES: nucleotide disphospho-sugar-binding domain-containing protein [unclassified Streptomyces]|uniref:nucleotide disphospho-sugar-binding domain-containing protein n=1 Tax=unclassified Streptomyces TaxID=2593676 RepID=UPI0011A752DC|nr:nucleotide disphospho-sugar-binding domain-containing protein [Streptomyces sp. BK340]